ncbi:fungal-specific transcription factor domain-containing protein [Ilyonectria sp. MPI-CAGE-AT-0026]|nr:fungal-specific transcription factor domain-containing protein [Ilyonectria sp. MPI-CAGE-AT-0026]
MADIVTATPEVTLAQKPCLNCRNRKIACDRSLPTCTTCTRRKKVCSGYAVNLSWPRAGDKRRATVANVQNRTTTAQIAFLNTSTWDVSLYMNATGAGTHATHVGVWQAPRPRLALRTPQFGTQMTPAEYSSAMQMVTSQGDLRQDICSLLQRMSLGDDTPPSLAVRHSMNAISYLHLQNSPKSVHHRMLAISSLRKTIGQVLDVKSRSQAIAASMLLSIYEAVDRSTTKDWSIYFDGCLMIFETGQQTRAPSEGDGATLLDWVLYYNVFYKFGIAHWMHRTKKQEVIANRENVISLATFHPKRQIIQSTLGCSLEILGILSQAVDLVRFQNDNRPPSEDHQRAIDALQHRLERADQQLCSGMDIEVYHGTGSKEHYTAVARLFQLAVLMYLDRVVRGSPASSPVSQDAAKESFGILRHLGVCERPFPMFMLSLQAEEEPDRVLMLKALQSSRRKRALSNLDSTEEMIQRIWAQQDLHGSEGIDARLVIDSVFSAYKTPPCLA